MSSQTIPKFDFDRKFQTKLVRCLFQFPEDAREIVLSIEPSMFDTAPLRWVVKKLKWSLTDNNLPATMTILEHEAVTDAKAGTIQASYIDAFSDCLAGLSKSVPDKTFILDKAFEYIKFVTLREFVISASEDLQNPAKVDWAKLDRSLASQCKVGTRVEGGLGQDYFTDTADRLSRLSTVEKTGIPTGLVIDTRLRHKGLPPRQLGCIIAPPGRGKTALLVYIGGSAILAGKSVLHISLELDEDIIGERYDARFSNIVISKLTKKKKRVKSRLAKIMKSHGGSLRLKYFPTPR